MKGIHHRHWNCIVVHTTKNIKGSRDEKKSDENRSGILRMIPILSIFHQLHHSNLNQFLALTQSTAILLMFSENMGETDVVEFANQ